MQSVKKFVQTLKNQNTETLQRITSSKEEYEKFLDFSSRLYKYPLAESLSIYAQRPDAQAVGMMREWNNHKIGRSVIKGTSPFRIPDSKKPNNYKNVFELSDTHGKEFVYRIGLSIADEAKSPLLEALGVRMPNNNISFDVAFTHIISRYIGIAYIVAAANIKSNITNLTPTQSQILNDESFKAIVKESVAYILCQRSNIQPIGNEDTQYFAHLHKFSSNEAATVLGNVNQILARQAIEYVNDAYNSVKEELEASNYGQNGQRSAELLRRPEDERHNVSAQGVSENVPAGEGSVLSESDGDTRNRTYSRTNVDSGLREPRRLPDNIADGSNTDQQPVDDGGRRCLRASSLGQVRQDMDGLHAEQSSEPSNSANKRGHMGNNSFASTTRSVEDDERFRDSIPSEEHKTSRELHADSSMGERQDQVGGRNNYPTDITQITLRDTDHQKELADDASSFLEYSSGGNLKRLFVEAPTYQGTPMWQDYQALSDKYNGHVLFYRLRDFYEVLGEKAHAVAEALDVTLIARDVGVAGRIPMLGVPHHSLDDYLKVLTEKGFDVIVRHGHEDVELHLSSSQGIDRSDSIVYFDAEINFQDEEFQSIALDYSDKIGFYRIDDFYYVVVDRETKANNVFAVNHDSEFKTVSKFRFPISELDEYINKFSEKGLSVEVHHEFPEVPTDTNFITSQQVNLDEVGEKQWDETMVEVAIKLETSSVNSTDTPTSIPIINMTSNFIIQDESSIGMASGKTKFNLNLEAIKILKAIEDEGRYATPEEQVVLAKYSGFGGIPQAFDYENQSWARENEQLKEVVTVSEHSSLAGSTLNAHYTSIEVVRAMYDGLERLGFKGGTVLEPSMGTGYFFGAMPESMRDNSRLYGVELDSLTGRIAKQLYPQANIEVSGFENANIPDNFVDVAVGNVPFGTYKVHDTKFNKHNFFIHDYFIAKSLDKVRPGGVIAYITTSGTMDKANTSLRKYVAERAELLGAVRLPNTAFKQSAGTEVTTDILFLQKRDGIVDATNEGWVYTGQYNTSHPKDSSNTVLPLNRYFIENPHMMLGEMAYSDMYGNERSTTLLPFSKPKNEVDIDEWLTGRFREVRNDYRGTLNYYGYRALEAFERYAKEKGYFDISVVEEMPVPDGFNHHQDAVSAYNDIFNSRFEDVAEEIAARVNWVDKPDYSNVPLDELLRRTMRHLPQNVMRDYATLEDLEDIQDSADVLPADPAVKNFCYTLVDDRIYYRENSVMTPVDDLSANKEARLRAMMELRQSTRYIIDLQMNDCSDDELISAQNELGKLYDSFVKKYNNINSAYNKGVFKHDADFALLSALESIDDDGNVEKAHIFNKRTIAPYRKIESVETAEEALAASLYEKGKVDIGYMQILSGKSYDEIVRDLQGLIFKNPISDSLDIDSDSENILYKNWETADEFLSGKVVDKLNFARQHADLEVHLETFAGIDLKNLYAQNIPALEIVQPTPLQAHEINVNIGNIWIDPKYYHQFMVETFKLNYWQESQLKVEYSNTNNKWHVEHVFGQSKIEISQTYGTSRMDAYTLMQTMLNQQQPEIKDTIIVNGKEKRVLNRDETIAIKERQTTLNEAFRKWIFEGPERREELVSKYNKLFNSEKVREYDGSFLRFEGMNPEVRLNKHQRDGVARIIFGGNTLLAHCVGAGKTYTMVAAAMEMKRMGIVNKPFFVVPNHIVNQWSNEFMELYPAANILTASKDDLKKDNRKIFMAKIATGDWDAVIVPQSVFGQIPVSIERQQNKLKAELDSARSYLEDLNLQKRCEGQDNKWSVKQIEASIKRLEAQLQNINEMKKDDVLTFEDTGADALFADEAHAYKNKNIFTKMTRVAGLQARSDTKRTKDMELKVEYINEVSNAPRNVVFATGTPVSNSMVELYTMKSYLIRDTLREKNLHHFDNWAANFGRTVSQVELAPSGQTFRTKQRFSEFQNVPQMMNIFRMCADIKTPDMLNLPVPEMATGKPITIDAEASEAQKELVKALVELSEKINNRDIKPEEYNMLMVTNHGKLGALDMRCLDINTFRSLDARFELGIDFDKLQAVDHPNSKVNLCVDKVFEIYKSTEADKLTQMIFCDQSTPKENSNKFTVYQDIKDKLIAKGVKLEEIAFIHDAKSNEAKEKIFNQMRSGKIRVLIGSTNKMGTGTNAQRLLVALHNLDCPWRPADLEQRIGRIVRQGNTNAEVGIYNYVTKGTFDAYSWQIIETKQKYISQVMSGKISPNSMDEIDALVLNYAEVKSIATGNPLIKRKMELEIEVQRLRVLERQYTAQKFKNQDDIIKEYPRKIAATESHIKGLEQDLVLRNQNTSVEFSMILGKNVYDERKDAGALLLKAAGNGKYADKEVGVYKGFKIVPMIKVSLIESPKVALIGSVKHIVELSDSEVGSITRIENALNGIEQRIEDTTQQLNNTRNQFEATKTQVDLPFEQAEQLEEAQKELISVNNELDIGKESSSNVVDEERLDEAFTEDVEMVEEAWEDEM